MVNKPGEMSQDENSHRSYCSDIIYLNLHILKWTQKLCFTTLAPDSADFEIAI